MKSSLEKLGLVRAKDRKSYPRIIMSISGLEKQGKTHFSLTAPGPLVMFSSDIGEEGVVSKFDDKDIMIMDVARADVGPDKAEEEFLRFKTAYVECLRGDFCRTIVLDTATEIWELLRLARFGKLTQVMPYQYGPVNAEYRALIRDAYGFDKNIILLHKMKPQYINDKRTGDYERSGFSDTGFLVQVNATVYRYSQADGGEFALEVKDCRQNPDLAGMEFEGDMCDFGVVAGMVLPDVDPRVWG